MLGRLIRKMGRVVYQHPSVAQDVAAQGTFGRLKVALVADYFTTACLGAECRIRSLTPHNYRDVICNWQPDLLFVESAFHGLGGEWRYELAKQSPLLHTGSPKVIASLVRLARDRGIPAVFWNKDDGAFFDAFIDVARLFEHVFTTDNRSLPSYAQALPAGSSASVLPMPYQPAFHHFTGFAFEEQAACFVGSYYRRILKARKQVLDMMFAACERTQLPMHVFDRNTRRLSHFFEFRFPQKPALQMHDRVPYEATAAVYKRYAVSINVNSVTSSETMCSRRLLEILACGGVVVTNPSPAVERSFGEYCHVIGTAEQAEALFGRLKYGLSAEDRDRAEAGAAYVRAVHTWEHRLEQLADAVAL